MHRLLALAATIALSGYGLPAAGQPGTTPTTGTDPGADGAAADPAWDDYDEAFTRLARGDADGARASLVALVDAYPAHPAAARARDYLDALAAPAVAADESPTRLARAELAFFMTLNGVLAGAEVCAIADCDGARATSGALLAGGALGLGTSLYASRGGITPGQALLLDSAISWGSWNTLVLLDDVPESRREVAWALGAQAAGLGAGLLLAGTWSPRAGDVSLTNTAGAWTAVLTALAFGAADADPSARAIGLAGDAGLVLGAGLSTRVDMSRGRTLLIDAGGVLGFVAGGAVALMLDGKGSGAEFVPMLAGTAAGLAIATHATSDWDLAGVPGHLGVAAAPVPGGATAMVSGRW